MKRKLFTCSGEKVEVVWEMEVGSIVFLLNMDSNALVGPFARDIGNANTPEPPSWVEEDEACATTIIVINKDLVLYYVVMF
jgi:hypothetical protein